MKSAQDQSSSMPIENELSGLQYRALLMQFFDAELRL